MMNLPFSVPFRKPVSKIDFPDYYRFIAAPMDLSMVRESLNAGYYGSSYDFRKDIELIFKNSKEYNTNPKSKVLSMTFKLEDWFKQRMSRLSAYLFHICQMIAKKEAQGQKAWHEHR